MSKSNWFISYVCTPNGPMWTVIMVIENGYVTTGRYFENEQDASEYAAKMNEGTVWVND